MAAFYGDAWSTGKTILHDHDPRSASYWPLADYVDKPTLALLDHDPGAPPEQAWRRKLNSHVNFLRSFSLTFMELLSMLPLGLRMLFYVGSERAQGRTPPIDPFTWGPKPSACHGVPLGGMGGGSIGRGFRGEFNRWQLIPGVCEESPVLANQFSVFVTRDKEDGGAKKQTKISSVLSPGRPQDLEREDKKSGILSWDWNLNGQYSTYHALFPRAWTIYDGEPDSDLKISCRQISPFIPHNYTESSFPVCVFSYVLVNTGNENADVSLLFTWANSIGGTSASTGGHFNEPYVLVTIPIYQKLNADIVLRITMYKMFTRCLHRDKTAAKGDRPVTFAIAAKETQGVTISTFPCFSILDKEGDHSAKAMWGEMKEKGAFDSGNWHSGISKPSQKGASIGAALAAQVLIPPNEKKEVVFALAWDSPEAKFGKGTSYYRRYTQFYGTKGHAASKLAHDALLDYRKWEVAIEDWQQPILRDETLPEWYRITLFNELYYLVAGGTVWTGRNDLYVFSNA
ncbi:unnamed protein product [Sphagnum jensenii]